MGSGNQWWRALIALGVVIALPVLATPKVSNAVSNFLYGDSGKVVPPLPELKPQADETVREGSALSVANDFNASKIAQAGFQEEDAQAMSQTKTSPFSKGSFERDNFTAERSTFDSPTPLAHSPAPPLLAPPPTTERSVPRDNPDRLDKVREIRDQLATWGAEYILLEALDDGKKFRFCCLMADKDDPQRTFPFEATAPDAGVAAESVRTAVQSWRQQQGAIR